MKKITSEIKPSSNKGIVHDSRADVRVLGEYCNMLKEKINELIEEIDRLKNPE